MSRRGTPLLGSHAFSFSNCYPNNSPPAGGFRLQTPKLNPLAFGNVGNNSLPSLIRPEVLNSPTFQRSDRGFYERSSRSPRNYNRYDRSKRKRSKSPSTTNGDEKNHSKRRRRSRSPPSPEKHRSKSSERDVGSPSSSSCDQTLKLDVQSTAKINSGETTKNTENKMENSKGDGPGKINNNNKSSSSSNDGDDNSDMQIPLDVSEADFLNDEEYEITVVEESCADEDEQEKQEQLPSKIVDDLVNSSSKNKNNNTPTRNYDLNVFLDLCSTVEEEKTTTNEEKTEEILEEENPVSTALRKLSSIIDAGEDENETQKNDKNFEPTEETEKIDAKNDENCEEKTNSIEEKMEEKTEDKMEEKTDENVEEKMNNIVEVKIEEQNDKYHEEKTTNVEIRPSTTEKAEKNDAKLTPMPTGSGKFIKFQYKRPKLSLLERKLLQRNEFKDFILSQPVVALYDNVNELLSLYEHEKRKENDKKHRTPSPSPPIVVENNKKLTVMVEKMDKSMTTEKNKNSTTNEKTSSTKTSSSTSLNDLTTTEKMKNKTTEKNLSSAKVSATNSNELTTTTTEKIKNKTAEKIPSSAKLSTTNSNQLTTTTTSEKNNKSTEKISLLPATSNWLKMTPSSSSSAQKINPQQSSSVLKLCDIQFAPATSTVENRTKRKTSSTTAPKPTPSTTEMLKPTLALTSLKSSASTTKLTDLATRIKKEKEERASKEFWGSTKSSKNDDDDSAAPAAIPGLGMSTTSAADSSSSAAYLAKFKIKKVDTQAKPTTNAAKRTPLLKPTMKTPTRTTDYVSPLDKIMAETNRYNKSASARQKRGGGDSSSLGELNHQQKAADEKRRTIEERRRNFENSVKLNDGIANFAKEILDVLRNRGATITNKFPPTMTTTTNSSTTPISPSAASATSSGDRTEILNDFPSSSSSRKRPSLLELDTKFTSDKNLLSSLVDSMNDFKPMPTSTRTVPPLLGAGPAEFIWDGTKDFGIFDNSWTKKPLLKPPLLTTSPPEPVPPPKTGLLPLPVPRPKTPPEILQNRRPVLLSEKPDLPPPSKKPCLLGTPDVKPCLLETPDLKPSLLETPDLFAMLTSVSTASKTNKPSLLRTPLLSCLPTTDVSANLATSSYDGGMNNNPVFDTATLLSMINPELLIKKPLLSSLLAAPDDEIKSGGNLTINDAQAYLLATMSAGLEEEEQQQQHQEIFTTVDEESSSSFSHIQQQQQEETLPSQLLQMVDEISTDETALQAVLKEVFNEMSRNGESTSSFVPNSSPPPSDVHSQQVKIVEEEQSTTTVSNNDVTQLKGIFITLLNDPSSILHRDVERRHKAENLLPILEELERFDSKNALFVQCDVLSPIMMFAKEIIDLSESASNN